MEQGRRASRSGDLGCALHPDDAPALAEARRDLTGADRVVLVRCAEAGGWAWRRVVVRPDGSAEVLAAPPDVVDALADLEALRDRFSRLFAGSPVPLVESDGQGRLLAVNAAAERLFGRTAQDVLGLRPSELVADDAPASPPLWVQAQEGADLPVADRRYLRPDGGVVDADVLGAVSRDAEGQPDRILAALLDVTERNASRRALEELNGRLRAERDASERQLALQRAVLDTVDVGVVACDAAGRLVLFNRTSRRFHGRSADPDVPPEALSERYALFHEDGVTPLAPEDVPLLVALREGTVRDRVVVLAPEGLPRRTVRVDGRAMRDASGRLLGAVVAMTDITEARARQQALAASEARFRAAFEHGPMPMARLSPGGLVVEANPALRRTLALRSAALQGHGLAELVHPDDADLVARVLAGARRQERPDPVSLRLLRADGRPVLCEAVVAHVPGTEGVDGPGWTLLQLADVTERVERERALELAALRDALTGLGNRQALLAALAEAGSGWLLFVDLDGFKAVNDSGGHDQGDAVLVEVARRLVAAADPGDVVARVGGDEFVLLHTGSDAGSAERLAASVRAALDAPVRLGDAVHRVGGSVGTARLEPGRDPLDALAVADRRMYDDKRRRGTGRPLSSTRRWGGGTVEQLLRDAVEQDRLRLAYQPVVDLRTGAVVGAEALVRMVTPGGEVVPPDDFIPAAESSGAIHDLGGWVLREALTQAAAWKAALPAGRDFGIGVNLSPRQLDDPDLVGRLAGALSVSGIDPAAVVLELTEGRLTASTDTARSVLDRLRAEGVGLAVDDFGSGHASVHYLNAFPFTVLKVDRSHTSALTGQDRRAAVARGVFRLAEACGLVVVAEGIETPAERAAVLQEGAPLGQGWLFSRPVPAEELARMLVEGPRDLAS